MGRFLKGVLLQGLPFRVGDEFEVGCSRTEASQLAKKRHTVLNPELGICKTQLLISAVGAASHVEILSCI